MNSQGPGSDEVRMSYSRCVETLFYIVVCFKHERQSQPKKLSSVAEVLCARLTNNSTCEACREVRCMLFLLATFEDEAQGTYPGIESPKHDSLEPYDTLNLFGTSVTLYHIIPKTRLTYKNLAFVDAMCSCTKHRRSTTLGCGAKPKHV